MDRSVEEAAGLRTLSLGSASQDGTATAAASSSSSSSPAPSGATTLTAAPPALHSADTGSCDRARVGVTPAHSTVADEAESRQGCDGDGSCTDERCSGDDGDEEDDEDDDDDTFDDENFYSDDAAAGHQDTSTITVDGVKYVASGAVSECECECMRARVCECMRLCECGLRLGAEVEVGAVSIFFCVQLLLSLMVVGFAHCVPQCGAATTNSAAPEPPSRLARFVVPAFHSITAIVSAGAVFPFSRVWFTCRDALVVVVIQTAAVTQHAHVHSHKSSPHLLTARVAHV